MAWFARILNLLFGMLVNVVGMCVNLFERFPKFGASGQKTDNFINGAENYPTNVDWLSEEFWTDATVKQVRERISEGENLNANDKDGKCPLHYVVKYNREMPNELALALLENGADVNARDNGGRSAVFEFLQRTRFSSDGEQEITLFDILVENGIDLSINNKDNETFEEEMNTWISMGRRIKTETIKPVLGEWRVTKDKVRPFLPPEFIYHVDNVLKKNNETDDLG